MTEPKDPITLLVENPNLAFCAILLQVVSFVAALASWTESPIKLLAIGFLAFLNLFLFIAFGKWLLTGSGFTE